MRSILPSVISLIWGIPGLTPRPMTRCTLLLCLGAALLTPLQAGLGEWEIRPGEERWWREADGVIIGGSLSETIPHNTFISFPTRFSDFEMTFQVKLLGHDRPNAGVQIRSERIPDHHEMIGYQADIGPGWWGKLYDESRRRTVIGDWVNEASSRAVKSGWNDYRIRAEGRRVRIWINDVLTCDYTETDSTIVQKGLIALQAHSGPPFEVHYRAIKIIPIASSAP